MDEATSAWAREVEAASARLGLQLTPLRQAVLSILAASPAPLGAYAIIEALARREGKPIAPPTVYRTLDFFLEHGFVHRIESRNAFQRCEHFDHAHPSVLLLCDKCGRSVEVEDDELTKALQAAAERAGFRAARQMVEIAGQCKECQCKDCAAT